MQSMALERLYGIAGAAGIAGFLTFLHLYVAAPGDGPAEIGFAVVALVLMFASALPAAGLAAVVLARWPSRRASVGLWAAGLGVPMVWTLVATGGWRSDPLMVVIQCAMVAGYLLPVGAVVALVATRLAALRRAWIVAWTVGSVLVLAADAFVLSVLFV